MALIDNTCMNRVNNLGFEGLSCYIINEIRSGADMTVFDVVKSLENYPVIAIAATTTQLINQGVLKCDQNQLLSVLT